MTKEEKLKCDLANKRHMELLELDKKSKKIGEGLNRLDELEDLGI